MGITGALVEDRKGYSQSKNVFWLVKPSILGEVLKVRRKELVLQSEISSKHNTPL